MSNKYRLSNRSADHFSLWEIDEDGQNVAIIVDDIWAPLKLDFEKLCAVVNELNRLARLCEQSVAQAHLSERTHVQHAFIEHNITKEAVDLAAGDRNLASHPSFDVPAYIAISYSHWGRIVRLLKSLADRFLVP